MSDRQAKKARKTQRDGLSQRGRIWYFRRVVPGQGRVWVSTGCKDRNQARRKATEIEKDQNDGIFGWKEQPKPVVPLLSTYLLEGPPVQYAKNVGGSASSWPLYYRRLCEAFPGLRLDELTPSQCTEFFGDRRRAGESDGYLHTQHIVFSATWNRAINDQVITVNPWEKVTAPEGMPRQRILSYDDQQRLLDALSPSVRRAAIVVLGSGARNAELCALVRDDVDFLRGRLTIRKGKGNKFRVVPVPVMVLAAIKEQMRELDYGTLAMQFPSFKDEDPRIFPYAKTSLVHSFSGFVQGLGMPQLTIHDLRRTFGTRHAENNVPMPVLQQWMGHSNIVMTAKFYTNVDAQRADFMAASVKASEKALEAAQQATVLEFKKQA